MLIASRVSVCVREQSECVSPSRSSFSEQRLPPPPSACSRPRPLVPSWGVSAWVGPPGPQGSLLRRPSARLRNVRGPTSRATCVAASSPSWGGRNLGGQTGQDGAEDEEREPAGARDSQEVPTTNAAAPPLPPPPPPPPQGLGPQRLPEPSAESSGRWTLGSGPDPPQYPPQNRVMKRGRPEGPAGDARRRWPPRPSGPR
ncbi:basic salivary proline-rich protein 4-like [Suricata suricatta]|uniref:basic salivary proline-rich protein 4-like n=1 Tax=Suricata suricatta TaxID=37032 RepID=UPI001155A285|nr:basic salivary proline-rich protein 4-like [Suricata suricatta]